MSTTNGNLNNLKVTDPQGNVYVLVPVDTEARQAIEEAKELTFDENYFTAEETDTEVHFGLNGVPIGVDDATPLKIIQDDQEGFVLGADTLFTSSLIGSTFTDFSSASTYEVDQKVVHDSKLYNCTTAVSVAGVWNDANWTEIPLIDLANQYTLSAIQDLATKEYVDSLVVSSVSAAASINYVSANYVNNTTFNAYSTDVANQLATLSADKLDKSYSATVNSLLDDKLNVSAFNAYSANVNEILSTVDDKLDKTEFNSYSADIDSQLSDKLNTSDFDTYSATVDTQLDSKLDKTEFNSYSADIDSQLSDKLNKSEFNTYSASVDSQLDSKLDKSYSATINSLLDDKLDKTQFNSYSADVNSQLSDKLDTADFDTYSANIDSQLSDKLDKSEFDTYSADVANQVAAKLDKTDFDTYSATIDNQLLNKLDKTDFNAYSADIDSQLDTVSAAVSTKVDKVVGKVLSTNDFTDEFKNKLESIASSAEVNVQSNWTETVSSSDAYILNKPTNLSDFTDDLVKDNIPVSGSNNYVKSGGVYQNEQILVQSVNELKQDINGLQDINTFDELNANSLHLMSIPYVGNTQMILIGTSAPTSIEPEYIGQFYLDTTNKKLYIAITTATTGWKGVTLS